MSSSSKEYFDGLRIRYEEIASATNNFADENLIGQGSSAKVHKGQLLQSGQLINIVARKFLQESIILNQLLMSSSLRHKNLVSVFGICKDNDGLIVVNKHEANGSLDKHLSGSNLTWLQRLEICVGVAHALSYLHHDVANNHNIIHGGIKSSKILLDHNWEPKLDGFRFFLLAKRHQLHLNVKYNGALQYMDPAYETTRGLTTKSDVFSFGVVLFEVLFGRKATVVNDDNWYFARLARSHYQERRLDDVIDSDLRKVMDLQSLKIFSETAYCCLKEERAQRPYMNQIVERLERALELQKKHQNPDQSSFTTEGTSFNKLKEKNLDHLKIRLADILLATDNFSERCRIGSGAYGMVYKAELNHFPGQNSSETERKNKDELPSIYSTVAIKRIMSRVDGQGEQGFLAEIEMLSNCKHRNVVSLIGFCDEGPEMILVYEYVSNGSLDGYLENIDSMINLPWAQRIKICLDIAHGLKYLHTTTKDKQKIIHRDIKSANILLDDNWVAKISDFGLSKLHPVHQEASTIITATIAGTDVYLDPEYLNTGKLKKASDIYSFGVVMFEILCWRLAYDKIYNEKGLPLIARQCFEDGTLKDMVDPKIKEVDENIFMLNTGLNQDSLHTFSKIAYQCLEETQAKRPTMEDIITELEKAFYFQTNRMDHLQVSLTRIKLATWNFNDYNCIGEGRFWKLYEGEVPLPHHNANANACTTILSKRWDRNSRQGHHQFWRELEILFKYKHENIIALGGYCNERDEKIIIYEHSPNGMLDKHLNNASITWMKRLQICIDVVNGLDFLHTGGVIHRNIKSGSILLDGDWKAKICNLELSLNSWEFREIEHVTDNAYGSLCYIDSEHELGFLTLNSDIYSFGVVLFELLCGRLAWAEGFEDHSQSLGPLAKRHYKEGTLDELVFKGLRGQIAPQSLTTFQRIALQCLHGDLNKRPVASEVLVQLKEAFEFQEDHEIWEPKLPKDYEELIQMSKTPKIYSSTTKKDLYNIFSKGILLQQGKVWFSIGTRGERNEMISAKFSYKKRRSHYWQSVPSSRFEIVAKMLDISKLNTQIKARTQFLSPGVDYGVYLIFKFCSPRKVSSKQMYVNLTYKMGHETLHSYFATWRDDEWMMIELCRFLTHSKEADFKVHLDSFSRYYCKCSAIYVEGIEFREINNANHEQTEIPPTGIETPKRSPSYEEDENVNYFQKLLLIFSPRKVYEEDHHMISAKEALYDSSNMKLFTSKPSIESRFEEVIELLAQQVLHIKCTIENEMLSLDTDTEYACYLVFKLSEKCNGLHCPVIIRDLLNWRNKRTEILYFRSPSPLNRHNINRVPVMREDGWMEVIVWNFNSNVMLKDGCLPVNLKMIIYEGSMAGLIVYGLDFRPM